MFNNHCSQQSTQSLITAVFISDCLLLEPSLQLSALTACTHDSFPQSHYASLADYFNCSRRILKHFSAVLPELHWLLTDAHWLTCRSLTQSQIQSLTLTSSLTLLVFYTHSLLTNCIQLGWFAYIVPERSERTRRKHRLRHLFYCCVTYTS
jgi:hypothetical protein